MMLRAITMIAGLAIALAFTGCAGEPSRESTSRSEAAGLLLGFADGPTLLFASDGDSVRVAAHVPHLIVPRTDGYWFVVEAERCAVDSTRSPHGGLDYPQAYRDRRHGIAVTRAKEAVIELEVLDDCADAAQSVAALNERFHREYMASRAADSAQVYEPSGDGIDCTEETQSVTFVTAEAIAVERRYSQTEHCSPGGYATGGANSVLRLGTAEQIPLRPLLSTRDRAKQEEHRQSDDESCAFDDNPERLDDSWSVYRSEGRWAVRLWLEGPNMPATPLPFIACMMVASRSG
jgi:hypothetical protein